MNHFRKVAEKEKELVLARTPEDTGKLKQSIGMRAIDRGFEIFFKTKYGNEIGGYQHEGTKRQFVEPVKKQALHWDTYFSKGHWVGGIKAKRFFEFKKSDKPVLMSLLKKLQIFKHG